MKARRKRAQTPIAWRFPLFLAGVFLVKLIVLLQLQDHVLMRPDTTIDSQTYITLAQRVIAGNFTLGPDTYYVTPLYVYFLALVQGIAGSVTAVRVAQIALGTASVGLIFATAREWAGERAAWYAASAAALTGLFTFYEIAVIQTSLDAVLTAALLWTLTLAVRRESFRWPIACGVIMALATLSRPNMIVPAVVIVGAVLLQRRIRLATLLAAGLVAGLAPIAARNVIVSHQWTVMSSQGGLSFLTGNGEGATGFFRPIPGVRPTVEGQVEDTRRIAEAALGRPLTNSEISGYFQDLTWQWIGAHPGWWIRLLLTKTYYLLNAQHIALPLSYPFFAYDTGSILGWLVVGPHVLIPMGLVGLIWLAFSVEKDRRRDLVVWLTFVPAYGASVVLFILSERYRLPLLVPLAIGAGAAVDLLIRSFQEPSKRTFAIAAVACAVLAVFVNWPLHLVDGDGRGEERVHMAENEARRGNVAEAERFATLALERYPHTSLLHYRVGVQLTNSGNFGPAIRHLKTALEIDPNGGPVEFALGQTLDLAGNCADATAHYRRALELGIGPSAPAATQAIATCTERLKRGR